MKLLIARIIIILLAAPFLASCTTPAQPTHTPTAQPTNTPTPTDFPTATDIPTPTYIPTLTSTPEATQFNAQRAYDDVHTQIGFGPRIPGSPGHDQVQEWIRAELESAGWVVEIQTSESMGHAIDNIVAKRSVDAPQIILGAHYDSRMIADNDPDPVNQSKPVPGANDGASGVSVLLELARSLPRDTVPIWLVFFDAEDNGRIEGWEWILGSRTFVKNNSVQPRAVVIVDMIGDVDLDIYRERNSNVQLTDEIWATAKNLGYDDKFIDEYRHAMIDDHTPFLEAGIPAIDIIDFDYPYWHTIQDTADKVSAESLQAVGETLQTWIIQQSGQP